MNFGLLGILETHLRWLILHLLCVQIVVRTFVGRFLFHAVLTSFSVLWNYLETLSFLFHDDFGTCNRDVSSEINRSLEICVIWTQSLLVFNGSNGFFTRNWNIIFLRFRHLKIGIKSLHIAFVKQIFNVNFLFVFRRRLLQRWIMLRVWFLDHLKLTLSVSSFYLVIVVKVI